jgi:hypothetical protein
MIAMKLVAKTMRSIKNTAAEIPEIRPRPPFDILIIDCPIIAHQPIDPKNPHTVFARPCAIDSLLLFPRVSVISSISVKVIRDSVNPIIASTSAYGKIITRVSRSHVGITGI